MKFIGFISLSVCLIATASYGKWTAKHKIVHFDYKHHTERWAETYQYCNGSNQSPIALKSCETTSKPALQFIGHFDVRTEGFLLHNTGHSVAVQYRGQTPKLSGGPLSDEYSLHEAHFHWGVEDEGSEHQMSGNFFGMEVHLVHYKTEYRSLENALNHTDGLTVVAVMLPVSDVVNSNLLPIVSNLDLVTEVDASTSLPEDAMTWLQTCLSGGPYFTYFGSLTTPPCNEVVTWIVLHNTGISMGREQIAEFRVLRSTSSGFISENRRSLQQLNGRSVFCAS